MAGCPTILLAGTASGTGKTSLTLGLARSRARRGLRVQTFKTGPDYLDPTWLAAASGRPCHTLDGWMGGRTQVLELFARATADADLAIVEGAMGLFDGADTASAAGSTAEIAAWLGAPVALVFDARAMARSAAALVSGFVHFDPSLRFAGAIANRTGSESHARTLREALAAAKLPPLLGAVPAGALPELTSRHLGLVAAGPEAERTIEGMADAVDAHLDGLRDWGTDRRPAAAPAASAGAPRIRLAVARDEAFSFYYADHLEALAAAGAQLVFFSPLRDAALPEADALLLGGGYPEAHAETLAGNASLRESVRAFAAAGRLVVAECGGMMFLSRSIAAGGREWPMCGVLPFATRLLPKRQRLGYVEAECLAALPWGAAGERLRGHEYHYSEIVGAAGDGWTPAYRVRTRRGGEETAGFWNGNVLAGWPHLHWTGHAGIAERFVDTALALRR